MWYDSAKRKWAFYSIKVDILALWTQCIPPITNPLLTPVYFLYYNLLNYIEVKVLINSVVLDWWLISILMDVFLILISCVSLHLMNLPIFRTTRCLTTNDVILAPGSRSEWLSCLRCVPWLRPACRFTWHLKPVQARSGCLACVSDLSTWCSNPHPWILYFPVQSRPSQGCGICIVFGNVVVVVLTMYKLT